MADHENSSRLGFIASVGSDKLDEASAKGEIDASSNRLQGAERMYIGAWRKARGDAEPEAGGTRNLVGLALSGGGIRSATFSLGVMQALAHRGLLKKVDYLSTVSGGGYIGSALTWLVSGKARREHSASEVSFGVDRENFPFGAEDPAPGAEFSFSDFQTTVRRIEDDFGARLQTIDGATPDDIVPVPRAGAVYPKEASFAKQGHMLARITYADGSQGILIYLKTTLTADLSFKVKGYAVQNPDFPDQSTADQFFDEIQFEAYRELGFRLADKMMKSAVPKGIEKDGESTSNLEQLIRNCCAA